MDQENDSQRHEPPCIFGNFENSKCIASTDSTEYSKLCSQPSPTESKIMNGETRFWRTAHWSPDGACIMAVNNDNSIELFPCQTEPSSDPLKSFVKVQEGENIYDVAWYPVMNTYDMATCCYLVSTRDHPIHLWDAFSGQLRCTYASYDHLDQIIAPNSLSFNLDGSRIYCGFNNLLHVFDSSIPGREFEAIPMIPKRKSKDGQRGVISTIAFNPDQSRMFACGSYSSTIGLYDERDYSMLDLLKTSGGVTKVKFDHDGLLLYASSRKEDEIICWDIRNTGKVIHRYNRPGDTNQRMNFGLSPADVPTNTNHYLACGDTDGFIDIFNLKTYKSTKLQAHRDTVSSVEFHPYLPLLLSCSGSRRNIFEDNNVDIDNTLKIWKLPIVE